MGVSGPSLLIESTDSMIRILCYALKLLLYMTILYAAAEIQTSHANTRVSIATLKRNIESLDEFDVCSQIYIIGLHHSNSAHFHL